MIPPRQNADFVAHMEDVLEVYKRPLDEKYPVVCMDERPQQLIAETRRPIAARGGRIERYDYEYERCGTVALFLFVQPLLAWRKVNVRKQRTKPGLESTLVESVVRQICDGALAGDPRLLCQLWDYLMLLPEGHAKRYNRGPGRAGGPDAAGLHAHSIFGRTTLAEIGVQNLPRLPPFRQLPTPLPYTLAPPAPGRFGRGRRWLQRARAPSKPASPDFRHATGRQFMVKLSPARSRWPS